MKKIFMAMISGKSKEEVYDMLNDSEKGNPVRYCSKHGYVTGGKKENEKKIRKEKIGKFPILSIIS